MRAEGSCPDITTQVGKENLSKQKMINLIFAGGNLTFLVVRGAGHMVPISQPVTARQILTDFIDSVHTDFIGSVYKPMVVQGANSEGGRC